MATLKPPAPALKHVTYLTLPSGHLSLVDAADLPQIQQHTWYAVKLRNGVYVAGRVRINGAIIRTYLHRFLTRVTPELEVDHRNRIGLDNRRINLRTCTSSQNIANTAVRTTSRIPYRGVNYEAKRYRARVVYEGKTFHLGRFDTAWEAAQAYNKAALELWGEFALLNERLP